MMDAGTPAGDGPRTVFEDLHGRVRGEVRIDRLYRAIYATDASIYQIVPDAVALPRCVEDVQAIVRVCGRHGVPITPRGGGTGLTGGAVNRGVILDCSRYMNRILHVDPVRRVAVVEPGVVLDELNSALRPHGLHFAPDVAPSSRATIGGMIANNSCGVHSVIYGRTVDHVLGVEVVLADGERHQWGSAAIDEWRIGKPAGVSHIAGRCEDALVAVRRELGDEIAARFPKIMRSNGGYGLDRLGLGNTAGGSRGAGLNVESIICGSEGTLCVVVGAALKLTPLPRHKGLLVAHFADLLTALEATPACLEHRPAAVELLDRTILRAARDAAGTARKILPVEGEPEGILVIELYDDTSERLHERLRAVADDLRSRRLGDAWSIVTDERHQADVWDVRRRGLGLLMSRPGDRQPYDFVDDTAVDPKHLRRYIERFIEVLGEEGVEDYSYYAHASVGCLHVKPVLNLRRLEDVRRMHRVADRISSLVLEFGGAMTGEHGDGLVRSCWLEKMYGPRIVEAFRRIKTAFDPQGIFNPGKIVDPLPMTENLRWGPAVSRSSSSPRPRDSHLTVLDFSAHGGMAGLAEMCSGVGQCRQKMVGTMCPSYMATGDELHTTRARANALRIALSDRGLLRGLDDSALDEVMDLCLSCKACKSECPTGVDMARLKAEWQHRRNERRGIPLRDRLIGAMPDLLKGASAIAPMANRLTQSKLARRLADRLVGMDRRVPIPPIARRTFRAWWEGFKGAARRSPRLRPQVVLFVDTWTNYFTPQVGIASVQVLEALGCEVLVPATGCCGRPAISKGLLHDARSMAERNVESLAVYATRGVPIVGVEASCVSAMLDEWPQLVRSDAARQVARQAMMMESFLARHALDRLAYRNTGVMGRPIRNAPSGIRILYHGHCHQKALIGTGDAMAVLRAAFGEEAVEINSGCCGMAGSFGHEREHYELARAIGEQRLFPVVRSQAESQVLVSGFSCRHHIQNHTPAQPRHVVELLANQIPAEAGTALAF